MEHPTTDAIATITNGLAQHLKANKAVTAFFDDFPEASKQWLRPIFLKADGTPKKVIDELQEMPEDATTQAKLQAVIENNLQDNPAAETLLLEIAKIVSEKMTATNSINTLGDSNITLQKVTGNVQIGNTININDTTETIRTEYTDFLHYYDTALTNKARTTSEAIYGKTIENLDERFVKQFFALPRVKKS